MLIHTHSIRIWNFRGNRLLHHPFPHETWCRLGGIPHFRWRPYDSSYWYLIIYVQFIYIYIYTHIYTYVIVYAHLSTGSWEYVDVDAQIPGKDCIGCQPKVSTSAHCTILRRWFLGECRSCREHLRSAQDGSKYLVAVGSMFSCELDLVGWSVMTMIPFESASRREWGLLGTP